MLRLIAILVLMPLAYLNADIQEKINNILEPIVQIRLQRLGDRGGSGTIIYSESKRTFVLTNYHVIEEALRKPGETDEEREQIDIVAFKYMDYGNEIKRDKFVGDILVYDKNLDLALIEIASEDKFRSVKLPSKNFKLKLFMQVYSVGYPYMAKISANQGEITALNVQKPLAAYGKKAKLAIANADIIYGYSGGGVFTKDYFFIGIPQSIKTDKSSGSLITWLAHFVTIHDIKKFIKQKQLDFLINKSKAPKFELKPRPIPRIFRLEDFIPKIKL